MTRKRGFSLAEAMVVFVLMAIILMAVYKVFFSQAKMVSQSMEYLKVNDHFRKIQSYLGNDIREATFITYPHPVTLDEASNLTTPKAPCQVLRLVKQVVDPSAKYLETSAANPLATDTFGQVITVREVVYELEPYKIEDSSQIVPRYKLVRTEYLKERDHSSSVLMQKLEITDTLRDFVLFRTIRKPMLAIDIKEQSDRLLNPLPSHDAGTGNNLIFLKVNLERPREKGKEGSEAYEISLTTSFYKRGKEVFFHQ